MKHYYRIADVVLQCLLLLLWLTALIISNVDMLVAFYFITGGWFLISLVIHFIICGKKYGDTYKAFLVVVFIMLSVFCAGCFMPWLSMLELYCVLYAAPCLALLYTVNCFTEIRYLNKRPISYIK